MLLLAAAACAGDDTGVAPASAGEGTVVRVVDGDTVDVRIGGRVERIRLIGVDTPEPPGGLREPECFGSEASHQTARILPEGSAVRLERDAEPRDRYDRLLAYVHRVDDDLFVNLALVEDGFAVTLTIEPNTTFAADFAAAAGRARRAGLGLWGACGGGDTPLEDAA